MESTLNYMNAINSNIDREKVAIITRALKDNLTYSQIREAFEDAGRERSTATLYAGQIRKLKLSKNKKLQALVTSGKIGLKKAVEQL